MWTKIEFWPRYAITGAIVVILLGIYTFDHRLPAFPLDDAYITLHNAMVLSGAKEVSYAGVPALTGSTSIAHTSLIALLTFVLPPAWASMASVWLGILLFAFAVSYLASVHKLGIAENLLLLAAVSLAGNTIYQLLNGLETGLAIAGFTWALALSSRERPSKWLSVLCGVLPCFAPRVDTGFDVTVGSPSMAAAILQ